MGGATGVRMGSFGVFARPHLAELMAGNDSALAQVEVFRRNYGSGVAFLLAGSGLAGGALSYMALSLGYDDGSVTTASALLVGGFVMQIIGRVRMQRGLDAANHAVWWHNRDLPRQ